MKKIISMVLCICLLCSFTACRRITSLKDGNQTNSSRDTISLPEQLIFDENLIEGNDNDSDVEDIDSKNLSSVVTSYEKTSSNTISSSDAVTSKATTVSPETPHIQSSVPSVSTQISQPLTSTTPIPKSQRTIADLLNGSSLNPMKTNSPALDSLIDNIFESIHIEGMTIYEKVKACYDYLVNNCSYGHNYVDGDNVLYSSDYDDGLVARSYSILKENIGVCDNYSAAFVVMCRRIGLEAFVVGGTVSKKGGGRTGHAWTYILLNGTQYIFDPQVQDNNPNVPYYYFGKTYQQMGTTYEKDPNDVYDTTTFNKFEVKKELIIVSDTTTIYWGEKATITYFVTPQNQEIIWKSSEPNIVSVDSTGTIIGNNQGTATITATMVIEGKTYSDSIEVSCTKGILSFEIESHYDKYKLGDKIFIIDSNSWDPEALPNFDEFKTIEYVSSDNNVVSVQNDEIFAVGAGTATVIAKLIYKGDIKAQASCLITVTNELNLYKSTITLDIFHYTKIGIRGLPEGATVTWESSSDCIEVQDDGKVTAKAEGEATITATTTINNQTYTGSCLVVCKRTEP